MDDLERAERLIAAAFRGLMEGLVQPRSLDIPAASSARSRRSRATGKESLSVEPDAPQQTGFAYPQAPDMMIDPMAGPDETQMLLALKQAMREQAGPIIPDNDLAQIAEAQQRRNATEQRLRTPETQPGPGEDEGRGWQGVA